MHTDRRLEMPQVASVRRRLAAYLLDSIVLAAVAYLLSLGLSELMGGAVRLEVDAAGATHVAVDVLRLVVQAAVIVAVSAVYHTGAWRWMRATPAQRLLNVAVIGARSGESLPLGPAVARWMLLGAPMAVVAAALIEVPLAWTTVAALLVIWNVVLLFSTLRHPAHRGVHDRAARSAVVQRT